MNSLRLRRLITDQPEPWNEPRRSFYPVKVERSTNTSPWVRKAIERSLPVKEYRS